MKTTTILISTIILVGLLVLPGCGSKQTVMAQQTTGQELIDLDAAREKGLITEKEYETKRTQIMKRK